MHLPETAAIRATVWRECRFLLAVTLVNLNNDADPEAWHRARPLLLAAPSSPADTFVRSHHHEENEVKKTLTVLTALLLCAGLAYASAQKAKTAKPAGKTHVVQAEVVSADVKANTITVKDEKGQTQTVPVLGKAQKSLASVKAGEQVALTCQDNEKGEHTGIIAIKAVKPTTKAK